MCKNKHITPKMYGSHALNEHFLAVFGHIGKNSLKKPIKVIFYGHVDSFFSYMPRNIIFLDNRL